MALTPEQEQEITLRNIGTSDCAVAALMAVTGWPRLKAEPLLEAGGYRSDTGAPRGSIELALEQGGREALVQDRAGWHGDTPATFSMTHDVGLYLLYVEGHVMALVDGDLHNAVHRWGRPLDGVTLVLR